MRIRDTADPLSEEGRIDPDKVVLARSQTLDLLHEDLARYCDREIQGRSILIAGHRGSGKTTLVEDAIREAGSRMSMRTGSMRPLPIFLHGPSLLETWPSDLWRMAESLQTKGSAGSGGSGRGETDEPARPATLQGSSDPGPVKPTASSTRDTESGGPAAAAGIPLWSTKDQWLKEAHAWTALEHIILGIHRAVTREFVRCYRDFVRNPALAKLEPEAAEMAAAFEIELLEDPPAWRLREFWDRAGAMDLGVLFPSPARDDQGARELAALNGMCNAHQRISGKMSGETSEKREIARQQETSRGFDAKAVDALKPLGAVLAGATVTTSTAVASSDLWVPALLGLVTTWASGYFLKSTSTDTSKRERSVDRTFIPDLSIRTLDRVIPFLVDRLRSAGLAPVFVIDELDKVDELGDCIDNLAAYLKRLVSENVFSCFLVDRGYLEYLRLDPDEARFGRKSSLFSHRLLVSYCPWDFDDYLSNLIVLDEKSTTTVAAAGEVGGARADLDVLKWVLRHRSQLHALNLKRQVATLAVDDDRLTLETGAIRTDYQSRIDLTLQMAIELTFYSKEAVGWLERQPFMQQTLVDALYWMSRSWLDGKGDVDISDTGMEVLSRYLIERMAIDQISRRTNVDPQRALNADDKNLLGKLVESMVAFLGEGNSLDLVEQRWADTIARMKWRADAMPLPAVREALLLGRESLLKPKPGAVQGSGQFDWRYYRSGLPRDVSAVRTLGIGQLPEDLLKAIESIRGIEGSLQALFRNLGAEGHIDVFSLLSDGWRVIPTTPAWTQVRSSISNLRAVNDGSGNTASITQDSANVTKFRSNLIDNSQVIAQFLWCGAVLSASWSSS